MRCIGNLEHMPNRCSQSEFRSARTGSFLLIVLALGNIWQNTCKFVVLHVSWSLLVGHTNVYVPGTMKSIPRAPKRSSGCSMMPLITTLTPVMVLCTCGGWIRPRQKLQRCVLCRRINGGEASEFCTWCKR